MICNDGTEPPFDNEYWDEKRDGIYVDRLSNIALFTSIDKYDSGSGWPSFVRPISTDVIFEKKDESLGILRVEVRAKESNAHLGHVFKDGPDDRGGLRYCINSASLRFIAKEDLEKEGFSKFLSLFKN